MSTENAKEPSVEAKDSLPPPSDVASDASPSTSAATDATATEKDGPAKKKKPVEYAIRLTKLTKAFGAKVAVDGISLRIRAGSVYGLIGPNGAGKTTTFSMMAGYLQPSDGVLEVLGHAPSNVDALRGRLGVLPQDAMLPATEKVSEFLLHLAELQGIPASKCTDAVMDVLEEVDGKGWWDVRCGGLSHGMAKRVGIAQALLGNPEVVFLDEPTAGLDPRVAYEVRQIIRRRKGRCTMVISSHNLQELEEVCDGAAILDRGRVVASGSINELTASSEEIHIDLGQGPVPLEAVRAVPFVTSAGYTESGRGGELIVTFDKKGADAETMIGQVLWVLLQNQARIAGVSKGKGLERRVMELT
jgi:ABC-type multidrug transport system ATPase subunit